MKKKTGIKPLKKKAWTLFSRYIRLRNADGSGYCTCITCGVVKHWKEMQAGHFIPGRSNSILFEESGVHPQCARCNYNEGNGPEYFIYMEKTYGRKEIDRLRALRHQTIKRNRIWYLNLIEELKTKLVPLEEFHNV